MYLALYARRARVIFDHPNNADYALVKCRARVLSADVQIHQIWTPADGG